MAQSLPLTSQEAFSGISGSISLASWIFLLLPQLAENYKSGSAKGVSVAFLAIWFLGDVANLVGAIWAGLVPTVIALAIYFCLADLILVSQCVYYNTKNLDRSSTLSSQRDACVESPLLGRRHSNDTDLPGSNEGSSLAACQRRESPALAVMDVQVDRTQWMRNALSIFGVCIMGVIGWTIAWKTGVWIPQPAVDQDHSTSLAFGAQVFGYTSALCYLGARVPQIIKNQRDRSCEGLSLLFFLLSLLGNLTYGAAIIFHSRDLGYIFMNLPWLIGSFGTIVEDMMIFVQFRVFENGKL